MQSQRQARYQDVVATVITVAIHAVVVVFLLMNLRISGALNPEPVVAEAIPAEVIDEVAIRQELEQLAEEDRRRQRVEAERQARLARAGQKGVQDSVEPGDVLPAQNTAVVGDGDLAGFFRYDDGHRVTNFADAQRRAMAQSHLPVGKAAGGQG